MRWSRIFGNPCLWAFLVADARNLPIQPSISYDPEMGVGGQGERSIRCVLALLTALSGSWPIHHVLRRSCVFRPFLQTAVF
jgi:hypothetical protein